MSTQKDEAHGEASDTPAAKPKGKNRLVIIGAAAAAVLLLGGGGGAYMLLGSKAGAGAATDSEPKAKNEGDAAKGGEKGAAVPLDVPPILVNLHSPDGAAHFLKLHVMLVAGPKSNFDELKKKLPILMDAYQPFLRELRPEDLSGSASVYRIKEELMLRSARAIGDDQVQDVLIQDLIQQ